MELTIKDNTCWMCDSNKEITLHHVIPSHFKPKKNILVPICRACHDKIHFDDINGMYNYAYKIDKTTKEMAKAIHLLRNMLDENSKIQTLKNSKKITLR